MGRSFEKTKGHHHLLAEPLRFSVMLRRLWLKLMDPSRINIYEACLVLTALFFITWILETFFIGDFFRIDPYTPFLVFWALRAKTHISISALVFTAFLLETSSARPMGLILVPYLSAYLLIMMIRDSLVMSSPRLWSLLILACSAFVVLFEWIAFWLLSPMTEIQFLDIIAVVLRIASSLLFAVIFSRSMRWQGLQSGEAERPYA